MPSLTTREIARLKREHETVHDPAWVDSLHTFSLQWSYTQEMWVIAGGCRRWHNLSDALDHYGPNWERSDGRTTEFIRLKRRRIVAAIAAFARDHRFKMEPEPVRRRKAR